jgi:L-fucose mutarotase
MLIGISPLIGPDLLAVLSRMGHGDELVLADAHFPAESIGRLTLRADGLLIADLLGGILPLFALDTYVPDPVVMMEPVEGDRADPAVHERYRAAIDRWAPQAPAVRFMPRADFYERARRAFAVVATGETAKYGNIILKKGVTPI